MGSVSVRQALQRVADNPILKETDLTQVPVSDLICRSLFEIANRPDARQRGSLARANKARRMIMDRLVGKRRAGSHPATRTQVKLSFVDLTAGALDAPDT